MYDTTEEAKQKLQESLVLFNGDPVWIAGVSGAKGKVVLKYRKIPFESQDFLQESISDPRWDFKSFGAKLGYTLVRNPNTGYWEAIYLSRAPIRSSRQGLDDRTTVVTYPDPSPTYHYNISSLLQKDSKLKDTLNNVYPKNEEVFTRITKQQNTYRSAPLNRKLVLLYDRVSPPYLIYRNEKVGYTEDGVKYRLAKHKEYLREELTDMMGLKIA